MGADPLTEQDPRRIGPFTLLGRLGSGGMGRVYLGLAEGRFAAVKQVHPHLTDDEGFRRRFGHELDNLARLPAGVSAELLDSDRESRPPWLATAHVPGITLDEALRVNGGPMAVADVWLLLREAAAGLAVVHEVGIVHRDLKPSNVMLRTDGLTLIDFGVAMALEQSRLTQSGMVIGTPAYMSPEQASSRRDLTRATDVFALGCLLGYAATGQPPYGDGGGVQMLYRIIHEQPDLAPLRSVDAELAAVVADCLAHDPQDRPSAAELVTRAAPYVAAGLPPGPPRVRELLAARGASAMHVPEPVPVTEPEPESEPRPADVPAGAAPAVPPGPEAAPAAASALAPEAEPVVGPPSDRDSGRRKRRLPRVLVIPLVVVATGGVVAVAPYLLGPDSHDGHSPSGGGTAAAMTGTGTPTGSATPSAANSSATKSGSAAKGAGSGGKHTGTTGKGTSGEPVTSGKTGGTGGTGGSGATGGTSSGSGGSGGSSNSGGSDGSSSGSTGSSGSGSTITASGTHRLVSALDGHCLAYDVNHSTSGYLASCSSTSPFKWTYAAVSGGTFELRNAGSGNCLAGSGNNFTYVVACGSDDADRWKFGRSSSAGTAVQNVSAGQCLQNDATVGGYATTTACGTSADLLWSNS